MTTVSLFWHNCHTTSRKTERICDKHASYGRTLLKYCIDAAGRNTTPNPKRIQEKILFTNFWGTQSICWSISDFSLWWWRFIDFWQHLDKIPPVQNLTTISLKLPHQQMNKKSKINASPWHLVHCQALDYNVRTSLCAVTLPILVTTNIMLFKLQTDHSRPVLLKSWTWLGHCMNFMALLRFCATEVIRGAQITS